MANIEFDDAAWPVLIIHFRNGAPSDEEFEAYLETYSGYLARGERFATVFNTAPDMPMTKPRHAKLQAAWMKAQRETLSKWVRGTAFVLPSPVARGVLRAILAMQGMATAYEIFRGFDEALAWAKGLGDSEARGAS